jgi:hypothetical protein
MPKAASPKQRQYEHVKGSAKKRTAMRTHKGSTTGPTFEQLYTEARRRGIRGRSSMNKAQLQRALSR